MSRRFNLFAGGTDVLEEGAALDEPMAKLLTVLPWPYINGGGSRSEAVKDDVAGTTSVRWRVAKLERQR